MLMVDLNVVDEMRRTIDAGVEHGTCRDSILEGVCFFEPRSRMNGSQEKFLVQWLTGI